MEELGEAFRRKFENKEGLFKKNQSNIYGVENLIGYVSFQIIVHFEFFASPC